MKISHTEYYEPTQTYYVQTVEDMQDLGRITARGGGTTLELSIESANRIHAQIKESHAKSLQHKRATTAEYI